MAGLSLKTAAENFKAQLRTIERQAKDAQVYAKQFAGISGAQDFRWAADTIAKAVKEAQDYLDRTLRYSR